MTTKKKLDLKVLSFPSKTSPGEEMHVDFVRTTVKAEDTNRAIDFLNKYREELQPSPQNLLSLVWVATRTLMQQGIPGEMAGLMVERACTWVDQGPSPKPAKGRKKL